jgi:hypothetical protein
VGSFHRFYLLRARTDVGGGLPEAILYRRPAMAAHCSPSAAVVKDGA